MRLIYAERVIGILNGITDGYGTVRDKWFFLGIARAREAIVNAPTVDAVPVRHGKWISDAVVTYCSVCKFGKRDERRYDYCPACGARMDGGEDGKND